MPVQLRILLDLQPPALIIGEVPVKCIQLVQGHHADEFLDKLHRHEMARAIQHRPAPAETGRVFNHDPRHHPGKIIVARSAVKNRRRQELKQGLEPNPIPQAVLAQIVSGR